MVLLLSVIVCTFNRARLLDINLKSLVNQTLSKDFYEVIIVNNNSIDNTEQIAKRYTKMYNNFLLINEINQGLSYARNKGWKTAKGKYIAFIDDDAKADSNWCYKIIHAFDDIKPKPYVVGGVIQPWYEAKPPKWFSDDLEIRSWGSNPHFLGDSDAKFGFSGSNMSFCREILEKYNGFSIKYGIKGKKLRLGEETELFHRMNKDEYYFWYDPDIKVFHWTPIRNMTLQYRIKRSFKGGESSAKMRNMNNSVIDYLKHWAFFVFILCKIPYYNISPKLNSKSNHVKLIQLLATQLGYLFYYRFNNY